MIILVIARNGEVEAYSTTPQAIIIADELRGKFIYEQTQPIEQSTRKSVKDALRFAESQGIKDPE